MKKNKAGKYGWVINSGLVNGEINEQQVEDHFEIDEGTVDIGGSGTSGIDTEYVLGNGTDVESGVQVENEGNDNSEIKDSDDYDLEDDELSEME